jgi:hypothetical protein
VEPKVPARATSAAIETQRDAMGVGRLGTYSMLGAAIATMPLPILPGSLAMRVRGALVHDVCARHGLSVTPEARRILAKPGLAEGPEGLMGAAVRFLTTRIFMRLGPLTVLPPVRSGLLTFSIGHLLARYLDMRQERSVRIDVEEARRIRRAIERAISLVISTPPRPEHETAGPPEELRDQLTQITDGLLAGLASLPGHLVRRLEAAFDESIGQP